MPVRARRHWLGCLAAGAALTPASAHAELRFVGDFETRSLSQWPLKQFCDRSRATVYADRPGMPLVPQGSYALRLRVRTSDVAPCTPTGDPRGQVASPPILAHGTELWASFKIFFPGSFPRIEDWLLFQEDHGHPWSGSPALGFGVRGGSLVLARGAKYGHDAIWSRRLRRGHWYTFMVHKRYARNRRGWVELWLDGIRQRIRGVHRFPTQTLHANTSGPNQFFLNNYRDGGMSCCRRVVMFFDDARVGTLRSDVE